MPDAPLITTKTLQDTGPQEARGVTYAEAPIGEQTVPLKVDLFLPDLAGANAPLLVWLGADILSDAGKTRSGPRILAQFLTQHGVAVAVPNVRVDAGRVDLPNSVVERLALIEARRDGTVDPRLSTFPAVAATQDVCALLSWIEHHASHLGLSGKTVLAGSSTGAGLAFNVSVIAPHLDLYRPDPKGILSFSGTCPWPSLFPAGTLNVFALHNPTDRRIAIDAIRSMAHMDQNFELIESIEQTHGSLGLWPNEPTQDACARILARVKRWCAE